MADFSKIIQIKDDRLNSGEVLDDTLLNDINDTTSAMTDELAADELLRKYPYDFPGVKGGGSVVPTMDVMISSLSGISDDPGENGMKKWEKFMTLFPRKKKEWEEEVKKNPKFGTRGWNHLKDIWKSATIDMMNSEIEKQRDYALHGKDENGNIVRPLDYAAGKVADFFTPRRMEAFKEGRDPTASETMMDFVQNAAYMVPMGGAEAAISRGLIGSQAGRVAGAVGAAAIAPSAITALDYGLGTKDYAGVPDALLDAGLGTATNLGINKAIAPALGALLNLGKTRGTLPKFVREFLEENTPEKSKARNLVKEAEVKLRNHWKETNAEYADKLRQGKTPDRLTPEQVTEYQDILRAANLAKSKTGMNADFDEGWKLMRDFSKGYERKINTDPERMMWWDEKTPGLPKKLSLEKMIDDAFGPNGIPVNEARAMVRHPELISLFEKRGVKDYLKDPSTYLDVMKSYVSNELGNDAAAQRALSRFNIDVKGIRKEQDEGRKARKASISASEIIGARKGALSPESEKYLRMIESNPEIVVTGIKDPAERDSFNMWLLREGNELLRGTPAGRPTWEVK